jgi:hypothetical protein
VSEGEVAAEGGSDRRRHFSSGGGGKGFGNGGDPGSSICAYGGVIATVRLLPPLWHPNNCALKNNKLVDNKI